MQFFKKNNSSNNNEMQAYIKDVITKLDYAPREDGLPDQQEGLGHYILYPNIKLEKVKFLNMQLCLQPTH